jgi:hypothetical protein
MDRSSIVHRFGFMTVGGPLAAANQLLELLKRMSHSLHGQLIAATGIPIMAMNRRRGPLRFGPGD